jgi:tricarballylate dehydrogenase
VRCDTLVIGGGNAALCAAISAAGAGARVVLLERAPAEWRGGNSKYTRNIRCAHGEDRSPDAYLEGEFASDLRGVTGEGSDPDLTKLVIERSRSALAWMESHGVRWQPALNGTLSLSRTNQFFLGGGKALINVYYAAAERVGVKILYEARAEKFRFEGTRCTEVAVRYIDREGTIQPDAVVVASGGFEANIEWLAQQLGEGARNCAVRGTRHNDGAVLDRLLDAGALPCGNPEAFHGIAVDARGPMFDGGIVTRIDSVPLGIVVNRDAKRFYDEGEDLWPKRYATWGRLIIGQPGQVAFSIFDQKTAGTFMTTLYRPHQAATIEELAGAVGLHPGALNRTVSEYNAAVRPGTFDPQGLDDCATVALEPPKSHWARAIDTPPYYAYPLRTGITFTYRGVAVDSRARVKLKLGSTFENVFAAGEAVAGNILTSGYVAGFGMTIGTVFGRIAGEEAGELVRA